MPGLVSGILPGEGVDKALGYGGMGFSMLRQKTWNPMKSMGGLGTLIFARPGSRIRQAGMQKKMLMGKTSSQMEKSAFLGAMKKHLLRGGGAIRDFIAPVARESAEAASESGARRLRPGLAAPLAMVGAGGLIYGGAKGLDYLEGQADMVQRARTYRQMMNKYGPELREMAESEGGGVSDERMRDLYNALYKAAPDVAKEPTLAASQMVPLIKETQAVEDTGVQLSFPSTMMAMMAPASTIQRGIPRRGRPSDYMSAAGTAANLAMGMNPAAIAATEAARSVGQTGSAGQRAAESLAVSMGAMGRKSKEMEALLSQRARSLGAGDDTSAIDARLKTLTAGDPEIRSRLGM